MQLSELLQIIGERFRSTQQFFEAANDVQTAASLLLVERIDRLSRPFFSLRADRLLQLLGTEPCPVGQIQPKQFEVINAGVKGGHSNFQRNSEASR